MLFFTRILNFRRAALAKLRDKRRSTRFPVGSGFPLKATLNLAGQVGADARGSGVDWSGRLANLSTNGVCVQLPPAAASVRGEHTELRLTLENNLLQIPCTVAHFRVYSSHALCGVALEFGDFNVQKAFLQLVEGVSIGASFEAETSPVLVRNSAGLVREQFRAGNKATLTAWRESADQAPDNFEMVIGDHRLKGGRKAALEVTSRKSEKAVVSEVVDAEVRQLFRWVLLNLPKGIPTDLRKLMDQSTDPGMAKTIAEAAARGSTPTQWLPPPIKRKA